MSVDSDVRGILENLNRIKRDVKDARDFETHEHELLEIDGKLAVIQTSLQDANIEFANKNVISALLEEARQARSDVTLLIEESIRTSDWCNCEWYDDVVMSPLLNARVREWMTSNTHDKSHSVRDDWSVPPKSTDDLRTLTRIHWREWRYYFISGCLDSQFRVVRKGGRMFYNLPFSEEEVAGKSFTAIRVFERIRPYVYYDYERGGLYYRSQNSDGTVEVRRILSSEEERRAVFSKFWNDPGICSHRGRATSHARFLVSFLGISRLDVELFIKETELYQVSSKHKVIPKVVQPLVTSRPMEHMQADLVDMGAFNSQNSHRYILVMVDLFSKYVWARALKTKDAPEVMSAIMDVLWNEGFPTIFQTDNGGEFVDIAKELSNRGIAVRKGRSYKPSSQGQVERTNRTLKQAFYMDFLASENYHWVGGLPEKVYAYNTMVHSAIRKTPYEIHRGIKPRNAPEFRQMQSADLLHIHLGAAATTILGSAQVKEDDLATAILADESLLMEKWGEIGNNKALLPSLERTEARVVKYLSYDEVVKTPKPKRTEAENLVDTLPPKKKPKGNGRVSKNSTKILTP